MTTKEKAIRTKVDEKTWRALRVQAASEGKPFMQWLADLLKRAAEKKG